MERQVGIGSAAAAIEPHLKALPGVAWTDITYNKPHGFLERLPLPGRLGGVVRGFQQSSSALLGADFDALCFLTHNPAVFQPLALARTPTLLWTDVTPALLDSQAAQYDHPVDRSRITRQVKHALVKRTFHLARRCVGWSDWARRSFVRDYGISEVRTGVIRPGVDLTRFERSPAPRHGLPRLLFVGGNFVRKGGDVLLDVFRQHLRGRCELDLVTRDPIAPQPGVRVYRDMRAGTPELLALYDTASVFVLPTRGDCYSIASMEAMAKGLPVIVTAVGGIPEIVEHEQSGFLLESVTGNGLLAAIEALLGDVQRASAMGRRGRQLAEQLFDARATASALTSCLTSLVRSGAAV
jgi:glycosyltransferase involved in cell wall biosynthesis